MIDSKVITLVFVVQLSSLIFAFRGSNHDSTSLISSNHDSSLFLFVNRSSNSSRLEREQFCGGILLTRYHLLTTESCAKKVKRRNLSPFSLAELRLAEDEIESDEVEPPQISEIYLEKQNQVALILLSSPRQTLPKRRSPSSSSHQRKRQQNVLKIESPFQDYFEEQFQTVILVDDESVTTKLIDCRVQTNFSRIENVNCRSLKAAIDGWPLLVAEKKSDLNKSKDLKRNRVKNKGNK